MLKSVERNPSKFLNLLKVVNAFFSQEEEDNKLFLYHCFSSSSVWRDLDMWEQCFNLIQIEKQSEFDGVPIPSEQKKKGGFGLLNPWNIVQGL
jgi:hypothetical protein